MFELGCQGQLPWLRVYGGLARVMVLLSVVLVVAGEPSTSIVRQFTMVSEPAGDYTVDWCPGSEYAEDPQNELTAYTVIDGECVCSFVSTDVDGNPINCPAGYFCPHGNSTAYECKPGFYCPGNISQPPYCCPGYYCPTPTEMYKCPKDHYCRTGFVQPYDCPPMSKCEEGATDPIKIGPIIITVLVVVSLYFGFEMKKWYEEKVKAVIKKALEELHEHKVDHGKVLVPIKSAKIASSKTFNIEFTELGCTLPNGVTIMKGVTGHFKAGRTCAVMGPSGAGKTTVITLITGKFKKTSGSILINGKEEEGLMKYKKLTGFVPQEDVMHRKLTVFDNLFHSAKMRLPADMKTTDIKSLVLDVIEDMGMSHVTFSIIGDETERGISGGQRKRVNIGLELVADPSVLFLDEPTSGLDSTTSYDLCKMLRQMATEKLLNVVAVIHSPSQKTFFQFTDLLLLGKGGRTIFMGAVDKSVHYFNSIGFAMPEGENSADFFLDVATGNVARSGYPDFVWEDLFELWENAHGLVKSSNEAANCKDSRKMNANTALYTDHTKHISWEGIKDLTKDLLFDIQTWFVNRATDVAELRESIVMTVTCTDDPVRNTVNIGWQFLYLLQRSLRQVLRARDAFLADILTHFMIGVFISLVAKSLEFIGPNDRVICNIAPLSLQSTCNNNIKDAYANAGNFVCFGIGFSGIASAIPTFGDEKVVYWREASTGTSTLSYFMAKWIVDIIRIFFSAFFFWMAFVMNYAYESKPLSVFESIFFPYYAAWTLGYCVSIVSPRESAPLVGVVVALLFAMRLSGTNDPSLAEIKDYNDRKRFIYDIAYPRYGVEAFYVSGVRYYEHVPKDYYDYIPKDGSALFEGTMAKQQAYDVNGTEVLWMNIERGMRRSGFEIDEYSDDLKGMFKAALVWAFIAYLLMSCMHMDKKK